jgi:predicted nucleic acid-binding protein
MLGKVLAWLKAHEGLDLKAVPRSFVFDILIAHSCREQGLVLVSRNTSDMRRIARVFRFDFVEPYPTPAY